MAGGGSSLPWETWWQAGIVESHRRQATEILPFQVGMEGREGRTSSRAGSTPRQGTESSGITVCAGGSRRNASLNPGMKRNQLWEGGGSEVLGSKGRPYRHGYHGMPHAANAGRCTLLWGMAGIQVGLYNSPSLLQNARHACLEELGHTRAGVLQAAGKAREGQGSHNPEYQPVRSNKKQVGRLGWGRCSERGVRECSRTRGMA